MYIKKPNFESCNHEIRKKTEKKGIFWQDSKDSKKKESFGKIREKKESFGKIRKIREKKESFEM